MPKYRTKPIEIEAHFCGDTLADLYRTAAWVIERGAKASIEEHSDGDIAVLVKSEAGHILTRTLPNMWITKKDSTFYTVHDDDFKELYEEIPKDNLHAYRTFNEELDQRLDGLHASKISDVR